MNGLRIEQMNNGIGYVRSVFDRDCAVVFTDHEGDNIYVYTNRPLTGYQQHNGIYVREFDSKKWDEHDINGVGSDARFMHFQCTSYYNGDVSYYERNLCNWEKLIGLEQLRKHDNGYAHVPSRDFWFSLYGHIPAYDFPEEYVVAHEMTHGVFNRRDNILKGFINILSYLQNIENYRKIDVLDEAIAVFMGYSYLKNRHPDDASRYAKTLMELDTDEKHENAFELVFNQYDLVKEIVEKLRNML
ncbi:MAG: hypothetical protein V1870_01225 [Candidatus Aenigmatarchaeota archaeon]